MLNLDKLREKLEKLKNKGGSANQNNGFLSLEEGKTELRITPSSLDAEDNDSFQDAWIHYGLGVAGFLCPKRMFNERCPACEFAKSLWQEYNSSEDEALREQAKKFMARQRFFSPVVLREDGKCVDDKVLWWGYSKTIHEKLLGWALSPKIGDFTDPMEGRDIEVTHTKPVKRGAFPSTEVSYDPSTTPLASKKDTLSLIGSVPSLLSLIDRKSSSDVKEIMDNFLNKDADDSTSMSKYGGNANKDATSDAPSTIDEAFEKVRQG